MQLALQQVASRLKHRNSHCPFALFPGAFLVYCEAFEGRKALNCQSVLLLWKSRYNGVFTKGFFVALLCTFEQLSILIKVRCPKLFKVLSHQCHLQVDNHFPSAAGRAISNVGQDALGLLGRLGTLLAYVQASAEQHF